MDVLKREEMIKDLEYSIKFFQKEMDEAVENDDETLFFVFACEVADLQTSLYNLTELTND